MKHRLTVFVLALVLLTTPHLFGATYYFSLAKGKSTDPINQQTLGRDTAIKVRDAFANQITFDNVTVLLENVPMQDRPVVTADIARKCLQTYAKTLQADDTFIMYTHSHGVTKGMLLGTTLYPWEDLAKDLLALPARHVLVFVMSCHSGALTDVLQSDALRSQWASRAAEGRTFLVMTPVNAEQVASPVRIDGAMINPFSHVLLEILDDAAAGTDDITTLDELVKTLPARTIETSIIGKDPSKAFDPQIAGSYSPEASFLPLDLDGRPADPAPGPGEDPSLPSWVQDLARKHLGHLVDVSGKKGAPGMMIGVVSADIDGSMGFGATVQNGSVKPTADTLFGIGSVTKLFTGLTLAHLVHQGKVRLTDAAYRYLPKNYRIHRGIRLQHLVGHYAGFPNMPDNLSAYRDLDGDGKNDSVDWSPARNYTAALLADFLRRQPGRPDSPYRYSNVGIGLLANALKQLLKVDDLDGMLRATLFPGLGMRATGANTPGFLKSVANLLKARGLYVNRSSSAIVGFSDMGVEDGAGELISNVSDLKTLLKALTNLQSTPLAGAFAEATRILGPADKENSQSCYGFNAFQHASGGTYYAKSGSTGGFSAIVYWQQSPPLGLVVLTNRGNFSALWEQSRALFSDLAAASAAAGPGDSREQRISKAIEDLLKDVQGLPEAGVWKQFLEAFQKEALAAQPPLNPEAEDFQQRLNGIGLMVANGQQLFPARHLTTITGWYRFFLKRPPDIGGLIFWCNRLLTTQGPRAMVVSKLRREFAAAARQETAAPPSAGQRPADGGM